MKPIGWTERPGLLAMLTVLAMLVPLGFALHGYRQEALRKDAQMFDALTGLTAERLQLSVVRHLNFLQIVRNQLRLAADETQQKTVLLRTQEFRRAFPHLTSLAYAEVIDGKARVLWVSDANAPAQLGDDLFAIEAFASAMQSNMNAVDPRGIQIERERMLVGIPVQPHTDHAGKILVGWFDIRLFTQAATCFATQRAGDELIASPLRPNDSLPTDAKRIVFHEASTDWHVAVQRGPGYQQRYAMPPPWQLLASWGVGVALLGGIILFAARSVALRVALEAERRVSELRSHFLHSVSHEFRTPLSVILSSADLIEAHEVQLSPQRRAALISQIKINTLRMNEMVEQVLLLGRLESGALQVNRQLVDVSNLCRSIADEVALATQQRCRISVEKAEHSDENCSLAVDSQLLRSALANLIENAVKYSPADGSVHVTYSVQKQGARFLILDHGIGIPQTELAGLFQPFQRGSNAADIPGTGLGLTIARRCAVLLDGVLTLESQEQRGTQATLLIPAPSSSGSLS